MVFMGEVVALTWLSMAVMAISEVNLIILINFLGQKLTFSCFMEFKMNKQIL